jgi:hypothetical protein
MDSVRSALRESRPLRSREREKLTSRSRDGLKLDAHIAMAPCKDLNALHVFHQGFSIFVFWLPGFLHLLAVDKRGSPKSSDVSCGGRRDGGHRLLLNEGVPSGSRR